MGGLPPSPFLSVPNVTVNRSTASVPITVLLYNGPLLCGFNVSSHTHHSFHATEYLCTNYTTFLSYLPRRCRRTDGQRAMLLL